MSEKQDQELVPMPVEHAVHGPLHRFEQLDVRVHRTTIPEHLLTKLPEGERFIVETINRLENQNEWLQQVVQKLNDDVVALHTRLETVESQPVMAIIKAVNDTHKRVEIIWDWKQVLSGKWAILAVLGTLGTGALLKLLFDILLKLWKP